MRIYPEIRISIGLIVSFLLVVAGAIYSYFNSVRAIELGKSVAQGLELMNSLDSLVVTMSNLEKSAYAYATTGNPGALGSYQEAQKSIDPHLRFIKSIAANEKRRYVRLTGVETQIRSLANRCADFIQLRKKAGTNIEISTAQRNEALGILELVRNRAVYIQVEEKKLVEARTALFERKTDELIHTYLILGLTAGLFFLILIFTLIRYIRTTRQAAESERRVADAIVEHAPTGVMLLDEEMEILAVNPMFLSYLDRDSTTLLGNKLYQVIPSIPPEQIETLLAGKKSSPTPFEFVELKEHETSRGNLWDIAIWPVTQEGRTTGYIVLATDVTDKVTRERQRKLLFNTFAHDLKNPLIGNQYLIRALKGSTEEQLEKEQLLDDLKKGNEDVLKMVGNIIEVSKIQEGKLLSREEVDLKCLLNDCTSELEGFCQRKGISIESLLPEKDVTLFTDQTAVKHLVLNLLENAIKFSEEGSSVTLKLGDENGKVRLSVQDSGPGMEPEGNEKVFTTTWQGELGRRIPGGSGVGMYLCGQLVRVLGGDISCHSIQGEGTTFVVRFEREPLDSTEGDSRQ